MRWVLILMVIAGAIACAGDLSFKNQEYKIFKLSSLGLKDGIKVDANGDGDIKDEEDYVKYNNIIFTDTYKKLSFKLLYIIEPPGAIAKMENFAGTVLKINGNDYFVTSAEDYKITLAKEFVKKKVYAQEQFSPEASIKFHNNLSIGLDKSFNLYIVENGNLIAFLESSEYKAGEEITYRLKNKGWDNKGYRLFVLKKESNYVELGLVVPGKEIEIRDGDKNVFGYAEVKINNDEFPRGANKIIFLSKEYTIERGKNLRGELKLDDPNYYYFKADFEQKKVSASLGYIPKKTGTKTTVKKKEFEGKKLRDYEGKIIELNGICEYPPLIKVDANRDGDIYDKEDYVLYNRLYVLDGGTKAQIRLVYSIETEMLDKYLRKPFSSFFGKKITIKGREYTVTEVGDDYIVVGEELSRKSTSLVESPSPEQAVKLIENYAVAFGKAGNKKQIFLYRDGNLLGSFDISSEKKEITQDLVSLDENLKKYRVIVTEYNPPNLEIAVIDAKSTVKIADESKAFGYELVRVNSAEIPDGKQSIKFLSKTYTLNRGESLLLEDYPYYNLSYTKLGYFKITRLPLPKEKKKPAKEVNKSKEIKVKKQEEKPEQKAEEQPPQKPEKKTVEKKPTEAEKQQTKKPKSFYELLVENQDEFNAFMEKAKIPRVIKSFTTGRYIVHVDNETVGIVLEKGRIVEIRKGGIENPTSEVWTSREFIDRLASSKDPIKEFLEGQKRGDFRKEDRTISQKVKSTVMNLLLKIASFFL